MKLVMHVMGGLLMSCCALAAAAPFEIVVCPTGDDSNAGTLAQPLRSLTAARDAIRVLRRGRIGGVSVLLLSGTHAPLSLDARLDSGTADFPIRYAAAVGAHPIISAGLEIPVDQWKIEKLPSGDSVLTADLSSVGLNISNLGTLPQVGQTIDICDQRRLKKAQLFHDSGSKILARYPNIAPNGDWRFIHAKDTATDGFTVASGPDAERVLRWASEESPFLHGYWTWDWADAIVGLTGAKSNGTDTVVQTAFPKGTNTVKKNARFVGLNLLSELDAEEEYYINKAGKIFYNAAKPTTEWTEAPVVSVSDTALAIDGVSFVTIEGTVYCILVLLTMASRTLAHLTHPHTSHTPPSHAPGLVVAHARVTGISAQGVRDTNIVNCTVFGHGADGVLMSGATRSNVVDCLIHDVGCVGMTVSGGNHTTLEPGLNSAKGNRVYHISQYKRTYQPGLHWGGVNNTYSHNHLSDGPHNCILGGGNEGPAANCLFEYNTLDHCRCY
jgi:hypothetical protein